MKVHETSARQSPRRFGTWLVMSLFLVILVGLLSLTYPVEELSRRLGDIYFRLRPPQPTSSAVALVLIDDSSLSRYGRWPWPRSLLARLVRLTSAQRPSAIGFDILLSEASEANADKHLAEAFHEASTVVLAAKLSNSGERLWVEPLPLFRTNSSALGHVQAVEDADGICRSVPLEELSIDGPRWALAVQLYRLAKGMPLNQEFDAAQLRSNRESSLESSDQKDGRGWKTYSPSFLRVNYREQFSPGQTAPPFVVVSAADLLQGSSHPGLRGKVVLIGFGATELSDRLPTPVSGQMPMPGVEVHANLVDNLITGTNLEPVGPLLQLLVLAAVSLISTGLILRWTGWKGVVFQTAFLISAYVAGYYLFADAHRIVPFGPILCAGFIAVPLGQLEHLLVLNRGLNRGFRLLRQTLSSGQDQSEPSTQALVAIAPDSGDLAGRMDLINDLQSELASHYVFRQGLLESMQEGLAVFSWDGKSHFRNQFWDMFCQKQGWDPEVDLATFGLRLGHPSWANAQALIREGDLPPEGEMHLGGGFWQVRAIRLSSSPNAEPAQWMVVVNDLTSRLERDQARAEALRFVTHELRTPLVSIQGFAEFLLRYPEAAGSANAAATIFRESQRLVSLINTYLDVLRFDAGARVMRMEPLQIIPMVSQVRQVIAPIAEAAEIRIEVQVQDQLPPLSGDEAMLSGVLLNLLNNAVKYSAEGSLVVLKVTGTVSTVTFEVSNPGPPIPTEDIAHLFEPFYRSLSTSESKPGWGLGLTFVRRVVEEHRGTIEAVSHNGAIEVRVLLPSDEAKLESKRGIEPSPCDVGPTDPPGVSERSNQAIKRS